MPQHGPDFHAIKHHFQSDDIQKLSDFFEPKVKRVIKDLEAGAHIELYTNNFRSRQWSQLQVFDTTLPHISKPQISQAMPEAADSATSNTTSLTGMYDCDAPAV